MSPNDAVDPTNTAAPREETDEERRARHRFDTETAATAADAPDDADEGTVMVDRSPAHADAEIDEGTVLVDRGAPGAAEPEDGTIVVDRRAAVDGTPDDGTIVVDRSAEPDDGTVVVDRRAASAEPDDGTVVVDRATPDDGTVVVERPATTEDGTLVVERPAVPARRGPVMRTLPRRGARREVTLAPGDGANRTATLAPGAGAIAEYAARAIPPAPSAAPVIELGPEASRADAPSMPSIAKQSRRRGLIALSVAAGATVISIVGLVLVIGALIGG